MKTKKQEEIRVWRPVDFFALEFKKGVGVKRSFPKHWHTEFQVCLIQSGAGDLYYKGRHFTDEGKLFFVPPEEVHANQTTHPNGCSSLSLYFEPQFLVKMLQDISEREINPTEFSSFVSDDKKLAQRFIELHNSFVQESLLLEKESSLFDFFAQLFRHYSNTTIDKNKIGKEKRVVERIKGILSESFKENVSLSMLSEITNMSPFHLNRVFKKETGLPPHAFQNQIRILQAKKLLHKNFPLAHIAAETGFADQSHFTRHFKRILGVTPGQYLQKSKNVQDLKAFYA